MSITKLVSGTAAIIVCCGGVGAAKLYGTQTQPDGFTDSQKKITEEIVSIFENDTPSLQYGYIENLHDGRGFTAGRGGFTSATGDMLAVLKKFNEAEPNNVFTKFIPSLEKKAQEEDENVDDLDGIDKMWTSCATDPVFCKCQDQVVNELIYQPSLKHWKAEGLQTPLGLLVIYDTVVEHGDGNDPDGTPAIIAKTDQIEKGNPGSGVRETEWLHTFLDVRRQDLLNPTNTKTQAAWADSVTRCDALNNIVYDRNMQLTAPINLSVFGENWTVTNDTATRDSS
ncbi:MAG TPA: chitosanase [Fimbriimonadaceae bacterium]